MPWEKILIEAIEYLEAHLLEGCTVNQVAAHVHVSPFYFQKVFKLMTGYSIGEYVRNRRLYLAALELIKSDEKVIELALKYGYDTPESFTKAFKRFHSLSPQQLKGEPYRVKPFHPLNISISIRGGEQMDYTFEALPEFKIVGVSRSYTYEEAFSSIPKFWNQWQTQQLDKAVYEPQWGIGQYGVGIDAPVSGDRFKYLIAGNAPETLQENELPEGLELVTVPAMTWVKFRCRGPMPESLQALNRRIYQEWFAENKSYSIAAGYNLERYACGDIYDHDYESEIWIPIVDKIKL